MPRLREGVVKTEKRSGVDHREARDARNMWQSLVSRIFLSLSWSRRTLDFTAFSCVLGYSVST
jgi:hypothetical protein